MKQVIRSSVFMGLFSFMLMTVLFAQNDTTDPAAQAETTEEIPTCKELITPETPEDVAALRECRRARKNAKRQKRQKDIIQRSVDRDRELRESRVGPFCIINDVQKNACDQIVRPPPP